MLSVRELLTDLDVRLLAGERSQDLPVRWVHISELLDPTPWLSGGELLLTTGMQLDSPERQCDFVARLSDHHLAGLGFGTGFTHQEVPPALLDAAAARDFPVFEVPYEVPFIAITEVAFSRLVNEQYAVLRRALAAHERLQRMVLSERGLGELVAALSALVGAIVMVLDARGELMIQRGLRHELDPDIVAALQADVRERTRRREARDFVPSVPEGSQGLALPVASDGALQNGSSAPVARAWLVAIKDAGPLSDVDRLTLHQAVTIVALELLRARVADDTERRLAGDVLQAMVRGEVPKVELARRLAPFGIGDRAAALVVQRASDEPSMGAALEAAMWATMRDEAVRGLVGTVGAATVAIVPGLADEELTALAERVADAGEAETGEAVLVGVGRALAAGDARRSFHEARCAVEARAIGINATRSNGHATSTPPRVATYKELGSLQLLLSLQDDEALRLFCDSILGPIEASEGHYGGELMRSLETFIEENGQWERAARRLYCHRHTLRYRIRRVEELTGRNLANARDRIEFWLAIRGREFVQ
jgi:purine catabolism regulator